LEQLQQNLASFLDQYYNQQRLHSSLGYRTPEEFDGQPASNQPQAAVLEFSKAWGESIHPMMVPTEQPEPRAASRGSARNPANHATRGARVLIVWMSSRVSIPGRAALQESPLPVPQPALVCLRIRALTTTRRRMVTCPFPTCLSNGVYRRGVFLMWVSGRGAAWACGVCWGHGRALPCGRGFRGTIPLWSWLGFGEEAGVRRLAYDEAALVVSRQHSHRTGGQHRVLALKRSLGELRAGGGSLRCAQDFC
jgi:hypothetical protein